MDLPKPNARVVYIAPNRGAPYGTTAGQRVTATVKDRTYVKEEDAWYAVIVPDVRPADWPDLEEFPVDPDYLKPL
jgi:hypothetical protein